MVKMGRRTRAAGLHSRNHDSRSCGDVCVDGFHSYLLIVNVHVEVWLSVMKFCGEFSLSGVFGCH